MINDIPGWNRDFHNKISTLEYNENMKAIRWRNGVDYENSIIGWINGFWWYDVMWSSRQCRKVQVNEWKDEK